MSSLWAIASLLDNPDLNHLGTGCASADFLPHQFNHLCWCMLAPFKAGWCHAAKSAEVDFKFVLFFLFIRFLHFVFLLFLKELIVKCHS